MSTLAMLADGVARAVSTQLEIRYGASNGVRFVGGADFEEINRSYWALVDQFRRDNQFPEGSRINSPKKAALTIIACNQNPHRMFAANPAYPHLDESHQQYCRLRFALEVMKAFLSIQDQSINDRHKRDLMVCILKLGQDGEPADLAKHLLCLYMDTFWTNLGKHESDDTYD
ncbi:MAG: hypothetical protein HQL39_02775 [Alphaproteobacteria bacterium]|nr:hypothetical protein [Alphaproteobacteria bacterium]